MSVRQQRSRKWADFNTALTEVVECERKMLAALRTLSSSVNFRYQSIFPDYSFKHQVNTQVDEVRSAIGRCTLSIQSMRHFLETATPKDIQTALDLLNKNEKQTDS